MYIVDVQRITPLEIYLLVMDKYIVPFNLNQLLYGHLYSLVSPRTALCEQR